MKQFKMKAKKHGGQFIKVSSLLFIVSLIVATMSIYFELQSRTGDAAGKGMSFLILPFVYIPFSIVAVILSILYYRIIKKRKILSKKIKVIALAPIFPFLLFIVSSVIYIVIEHMEPKPLTTITIEIKSSRLFVNERYSDITNYSKSFGRLHQPNIEGKYYIYEMIGDFQIGARKIVISDDAINASIKLEIPDTNEPFPFTEWKDMKVNNDTITVQLRYRGYRIKY